MQFSRARFLSFEFDDVPRRVLRVGPLEHLVARPGEAVPALEGFEIHPAQFPMPHRVLDAGAETLLLLLLSHLEPDLDQPRAGLDHHLLDHRTGLEESLDLLRRGKFHDPLDAGTVVPAAVEDHHFAAGGKALEIALHVHLALLAVGRRGQRHDPEDARTDPLGDRLDRAALAGRIPPFEDDDHALAGGLQPVLQVAEFGLKLAQFLLVDLAVELALAVLLRHRNASIDP